jgi:hypothetical protein
VSCQTLAIKIICLIRFMFSFLSVALFAVLLAANAIV